MAVVRGINKIPTLSQRRSVSYLDENYQQLQEPQLSGLDSIEVMEKPAQCASSTKSTLIGRTWFNRAESTR
jgi:hypothetical protein